jgi:hypothetical protein
MGEFIYEDNVLQFLNHEEGRIAVARTKPVYTNSIDVVDADDTAQRMRPGSSYW